MTYFKVKMIIVCYASILTVDKGQQLRQLLVQHSLYPHQIAQQYPCYQHCHLQSPRIQVKNLHIHFHQLFHLHLTFPQFLQQRDPHHMALFTMEICAGSITNVRHLTVSAIIVRARYVIFCHGIMIEVIFDSNFMIL